MHTQISIREFLVEEEISAETEEEKNEEVFSINERLGFLFQREDLEEENLAIPPFKEAAGRIMQRKAWGKHEFFSLWNLVEFDFNQQSIGFFVGWSFRLLWRNQKLFYHHFQVKRSRKPLLFVVVLPSRLFEETKGYFITNSKWKEEQSQREIRH